jgi:hypothetical protein
MQSSVPDHKVNLRAVMITQKRTFCVVAENVLHWNRERTEEVSRKGAKTQREELPKAFLKSTNTHKTVALTYIRANSYSANT